MSLRQRLLLIITAVMILLASVLAMMLVMQTANDQKNASFLRLAAAQQMAERIADQCFTASGANVDRFYHLSSVALNSDSALERIVLLDLQNRLIYEAEVESATGHETKLGEQIELPAFGDVPGDEAMHQLGYTFAVPPRRLDQTGGQRMVVLARIRPPRRSDMESTLLWIMLSVLAGTILLIVLIYLAIWRLVLRPVEQLARDVDRVANEERILQAKAVEAAGLKPALASGAGGATADSGPPRSNLQIEMDRLHQELIRTRTDAPAVGNEIQRLAAAFAGMERELREHRALLHAQIEQVVAERAQAQARWIAAERLNATGRLAAGVAHEVNNPLGGIRNALRTIRTREQARPEPDKRTLDYLDLMEDGLTRIANIVTDLLGFSRRNARPETVNLVEVATASQRLLAHRFRDANTEFVLDNPAGTAILFTAERAKLGQVFHNLLTNALDAILDKNADASTRRVTLALAKSSVGIQVEISDTGTGMTPETQAQATEMFFTTKDPGKGTGLGLAVVATIVEDLGGTLSFLSSPDGVTARILLPVGPSGSGITAAPVGAAAKVSPVTSAGSGARS